MYQHTVESIIASSNPAFSFNLNWNHIDHGLPWLDAALLTLLQRNQEELNSSPSKASSKRSSLQRRLRQRCIPRFSLQDIAKCRKTLLNSGNDQALIALTAFLLKYLIVCCLIFVNCMMRIHILAVAPAWQFDCCYSKWSGNQSRRRTKGDKGADCLGTCQKSQMNWWAFIGAPLSMSSSSNCSGGQWCHILHRQRMSIGLLLHSQRSHFCPHPHLPQRLLIAMVCMANVRLNV